MGAPRAQPPAAVRVVPCLVSTPPAGDIFRTKVDAGALPRRLCISSIANKNSKCFKRRGRGIGSGAADLVAWLFWFGVDQFLGKAIGEDLQACCLFEPFDDPVRLGARSIALLAVGDDIDDLWRDFEGHAVVIRDFLEKADVFLNQVEGEIHVA